MGALDGDDGSADGTPLGKWDGLKVKLGFPEGIEVGCPDGEVGSADGSPDGSPEGCPEGSPDG